MLPKVCTELMPPATVIEQTSEQTLDDVRIYPFTGQLDLTLPARETLVIQSIRSSQRLVLSRIIHQFVKMNLRVLNEFYPSLLDIA